MYVRSKSKFFNKIYDLSTQKDVFYRRRQVMKNTPPYDALYKWSEVYKTFTHFLLAIFRKK